MHIWYSDIISLTSALDWGVQRQAPAAVTPGKYPEYIVKKAGWTIGPVWTRAVDLDLPQWNSIPGHFGL